MEMCLTTSGDSDFAHFPKMSIELAILIANIMYLTVTVNLKTTLHEPNEIWTVFISHRILYYFYGSFIISGKIKEHVITIFRKNKDFKNDNRFPIETILLLFFLIPHKVERILQLECYILNSKLNHIAFALLRQQNKI